LDRFNLLNLLKRVSDKWLMIAGFMIFGALAGLSCSRLIQPIYESTAVFSVTIDYTQTGALTDIQEDQAMRGVGSVLMSDRVILQTLVQLKNQANLNISKSDFLQDASIDREEFQWTIRYRSIDQENAATIARIWSETANDEINLALVHANTNKGLMENMASLTDCLAKPSSNILSYCLINDTHELVKVIGELSSQIQAQKQESLGLFHALSVILINGAEQPQTPVLGQRNVLAIGGIFIGLITGVIAAAIPTDKWS
jgi:uncharacterized protein involved in exopolysaccharide biosynthesis